jgi:hypothetical protein
VLTPDMLHVVAAYNNHSRYAVRSKLLLNHWLPALLDSGVTVTIAQHTMGERAHELDPERDPILNRVTLINFRGVPEHEMWLQHALYNAAISRLPQTAKYICWQDPDIQHLRRDWAMETLHMLQQHRVGQTFTHAVDLDPSGNIATNEWGNDVDRSFSAAWREGEVRIGDGPYAPNTCRSLLPDKPRDWRMHCLPGDSLVVPGGHVISAHSQPYEGELVVIRTASGNELSCSPNHPIFADGRWVRADNVKIGDNVLRDIRRNRVLAQPDKENVPARIEDIVRSFSERPGVSRTTALSHDLNDHVANRKIAEIWTDGDLADEFHILRQKQLGNEAFGRVGEIESQRLHCGGTLNLLGQGLGFAASANQTAGSSTSGTNFWTEFLKHASTDRRSHLQSALMAGNIPSFLASDAMELGRSSRGDNLLAQLGRNTSSDDGSGIPFIHADGFGTDWSRIARHVQLDQVVFVGRREFLGQLYDLETEGGYIIADGVVTHNTGYSWAIRRDALQGIGRLLDWLIIGSGDFHIAHGFAGTLPQIVEKGLRDGGYSVSYYRRLAEFAVLCDRHIRQDIGCVQGTITHGWHGSKKLRFYGGREDVIRESGFDPDRDITYDFNGLPVLCGDNRVLRDGIRRYNIRRQEDSVDVY